MIALSGLTEFYEARGRGRSPESGYGFQNWDALIHVGCTGCITRPFHSCDMCGACGRSTSSTPGTYTRAAPIRCAGHGSR